jgi:urease accessory protein
MRPGVSLPVIHLVSTGAGPLGGDELTLNVTVDDGAGLSLRGLGALLCLPGRTSAPARQTITARIGKGGRLDARLPPTILADRCRLRNSTTIDLASDAQLVWSEIVTLGRHGENGGSAVLDLTVRQNGGALLRTTTDLTDPALRHSPALLGPNQALGHALLVGVPAPDTPVRIANGCSQSVHPLDGAALLSVVGPEARLVIDAVETWLTSALA